MHRSLAAALLAATALGSPIEASARDREDRDVERLADRLNDPRVQSALSGMVVAMTDMVMDLRIDRLRDAAARIDPDAGGGDWDDARTIGDVVRRDDPLFRERLEGQSRIAVGAMGGLAAGMADMLPQLRVMAERMGRDIERATRDLPR